VLSGGLLSTGFIPDTEEVTGSIPVSPTSTKSVSDAMKERGLLPLPATSPSVIIGSIQVAHERVRRPLMEAYAGKQYVGIDLHRRRS